VSQSSAAIPNGTIKEKKLRIKLANAILLSRGLAEDACRV
jgi:hypothetical protein